MSYITTLLLTTFFVDNRRTRWFIGLYAFSFLCVAALIKLTGIVGKDIYELYGTVFSLMIIPCAWFLDKWQRKLVVLGFLLLSSYTLSIIFLWGYVPVWPYSNTVLLVTFLQVSVLTFFDSGFLRTIGMCSAASIVTYVGG